MSSIEERLDKVRELIQNDDFLCGRGLSNEVNIRIFCYESEDEIAVKRLPARQAVAVLSCTQLEERNRGETNIIRLLHPKNRGKALSMHPAN